MGTVGVRQLKNQLTKYLRRARQGEEVVVTERGQPVAVIRPIRVGDAAESLEAKLAVLAARGVVRLPSKRPLKRVRMVKVTGVPVSRTVIEDRR